MTDSLSSTADVDAAKPVAYMRQLCKHFGHKNEASFGDTRGEIRFDYGRCELNAGEGVLSLRVVAEEPESLERLERVIGSHLERFGRRDGLSVSWAEGA
ncbi:MAG TPA: DUF2218 domain-containing protein [Thermoleophilaceae bacterium]|jgi:hypothetical protein